MSWQHRFVKMPAAGTSDGHLMSFMKRPQACGCTASERDGLICGTVVSTTAQDFSVADNHNMEKAPGGCTDIHAASEVHHSNKSSGLGCMHSGQHPRKNKKVVQKRQHRNPR